MDWIDAELKKARRDLGLHEKWLQDAPQRAERARIKALGEAGSALQDSVNKGLVAYERFLAVLLEMRVLASRIEDDFNERAFAPFWDGICNFAVKMGQLNVKMRMIAQFYSIYKQKHKLYAEIQCSGDSAPPCFTDEMLNPIEPVTLKEITDWFSRVMRRGQRDFQFASIYEHYRTRELLVEGFGDLVQKFADVSGVLNSINRSLIKGFQELGVSIGNLRGTMTDEFDYLRECIEEQQKKTRRVIKRVEAQAQERHEELLWEQEATREAFEESEEREQARHEDWLREQELDRESTTSDYERSELGQQDRHEEVISEGKRDRRILRDIDKQVGGREWWQH